MKNYLRIILILTAAAFVLNFTGCSKVKGDENTAQKIEKTNNVSEKKSCCSGDMDADSFTDNSIYQLESMWKTESDKTFMLGNLKGQKSSHDNVLCKLHLCLSDFS